MNLPNLLKITKIYRGSLKFMENIAILLKKSLGSETKYARW